MPRRRNDSYTNTQRAGLLRADSAGVIKRLPHSAARGLRDRSLGEIVEKRDTTGGVMPNGRRLIGAEWPTVTFRLSPEGRREAARLMLAEGNVTGAENMQVAPVLDGNK